MKKIVLNSTFFACLIVGAVSLWIVTNPVTVHAASASATCANGQTITCTQPGSYCIGVDSSPEGSGYCACETNGQITVVKFCTDSDEEPLIY